MFISYPFIASWMIAITFRIGARSLIDSRTSFKSCALGGCFLDRFPSGSWLPVLCVRNRLFFISLSFPPHFEASPERTGPRKATARPFAPAGSPRGRRGRAGSGSNRASKGRTHAAPLERRSAPMCGRTTRRFCFNSIAAADYITIIRILRQYVAIFE